MQTLGYTNQQSTIVSSIILIVIMIVFPISAYVSDKVGRRPVTNIGDYLVNFISLYYFCSLRVDEFYFSYNISSNICWSY